MTSSDNVQIPIAQLYAIGGSLNSVKADLEGVESAVVHLLGVDDVHGFKIASAVSGFLVSGSRRGGRCWVMWGRWGMCLFRLLILLKRLIRRWLLLWVSLLGSCLVVVPVVGLLVVGRCD